MQGRIWFKCILAVEIVGNCFLGLDKIYTQIYRVREMSLNMVVNGDIFIYLCVYVFYPFYMLRKLFTSF